MTVLRKNKDFTADNLKTGPARKPRLPRYTSYPTALQFDVLDGREHSSWLRALPDDEAVSLYFHIPFCDQLCWFCGCYTHISNKYEPVEKYLQTLLQELAWTSSRTGRRKVSHIHFGGGSPTILEANDFDRLMQAIGEAYEILPDAEIAVEVDPRTLSLEKVVAYGRCGVNRVSMGIQDFDEKVQKTINRIQTTELIETCLGWFRASGIDNINFDLIYGLPNQTQATIRETVLQTVFYRPSRIALFGYAHVPWMKKHQAMINAETLPGQAQRQAMFDLARQTLLDCGYQAIGLDHFALPGDSLLEAYEEGALRRNFQGYTADVADTLIGFGASAISSLPGGYAQNTTDMRVYRQRIDAGESPVVRGVAVTAEDRLVRQLISDLMCFQQVDLEARAREFGLSPEFHRELNALEELIRASYMERDGSIYRITEAGRPYLRAICSVFDRYLPANFVERPDILYRCLHESEG
ncbi:oxygen-independent coproporphyrinogen III oxidase [Emcibacter nanhaiensis]|uniref:Coproporphyrinogen-III oxidase n=1 Tax=Emcibacter nanhaiensis TaxID=1505037 RepID=A0A501PG97_9PROT|nr:oxygen-independent coproporphyrinogen III oxidase [Emcibacter nanhaiensis]TPD59215.1 oxygen-independent coproporphyrinogen III oxidase [Emcibacter nanhaiensis]